MWGWFGITNDPKKEPTDSNCASKSDVEAAEDSRTGENTADPNKASQVENENTTAKQPADHLKQTAKQLGSLFYNVASAATKTATKTVTKLKETVDDKLDQTLVGDLQRENERFIQEKQARRVGDSVPPWVGYHEEDTMKRQILSLSMDERNFLRDPPSGVDYRFEMEHMMPVALAVLKEDADLTQMRFKLVPKRVSEEKFWRNYFYRVSLIKQSTQLSTLADLDVRKSSTSSSEGLNLKDKSYKAKVSEGSDEQVDVPNDDACSPNEFASDAFQASNEGLSEDERKQMGMTGKRGRGGGADWEQELQEELESFELVDGQPSETNDVDPNWEKEIEDMLDLENGHD